MNVTLNADIIYTKEKYECKLADVGVTYLQYLADVICELYLIVWNFLSFLSACGLLSSHFVLIPDIRKYLL